MSERSKAVEHDRGCTQMTMGRGCWDDMVASVFVRARVVVVVVGGGDERMEGSSSRS